MKEKFGALTDPTLNEFLQQLAPEAVIHMGKRTRLAEPWSNPNCDYHVHPGEPEGYSCDNVN